MGFEEALQLSLFSHLQDTYLRKLSRQQELSWLHHSMLEGVGSPLSTSMPAAMCPEATWRGAVAFTVATSTAVITPAIPARVISATPAISVVVVVVVVALATALVEVRVVVVVAPLCPLRGPAIRPPGARLLLVGAPRWWWVVWELLKSTSRNLRSVNNTQVPFRETSFTWGDVAFVVDGGGGVVVDFFQVDDDSMPGALLPVLRRRLSHQD